MAIFRKVKSGSPSEFIIHPVNIRETIRMVFLALQKKAVFVSCIPEHENLFEENTDTKLITDIALMTTVYTVESVEVKSETAIEALINLYRKIPEAKIKTASTLYPPEAVYAWEVGKALVETGEFDDLV